MHKKSDIRTKPFLKWVGGKSQLLDELCSRMPKYYKRYFESFIGGGALLFATKPEHAIISDINSELINAYQCVQLQVQDLISALKEHVYNEEYYYKIREADRTEEYKNWSNVEKAARLIYLNKTCFNGLYRVNSKGQFNTPIGKYTNPKILDPKNLNNCSDALKNVEIHCRSFHETLAKVKKDDFVYLDPPYVPLNDTSYFTSYAKEGFSAEDQTSLKEMCVSINKKGAYFMLSNSNAEFVKELYKEFNVEEVQANRSINSKGDKRGKIKEVIVRNYN